MKGRLGMTLVHMNHWIFLWRANEGNALGLHQSPIPTEVLWVAHWGFSGCLSLAKVLWVAHWGFSGCLSLVEVSFPSLFLFANPTLGWIKSFDMVRILPKLWSYPMVWKPLGEIRTAWLSWQMGSLAPLFKLTPTRIDRWAAIWIITKSDLREML